MEPFSFLCYSKNHLVDFLDIRKVDSYTLLIQDGTNLLLSEGNLWKTQGEIQMVTASVVAPMGSSAVLASLIASSPVRAAMTKEMDVKIQDLKTQLADLEATRATLTEDAPVSAPAKKRGRPVGSGNGNKVSKKNDKPAKKSTGGGRPKGSHANHAGAILGVLKGKKNGLSASKIWEALSEIKHPAEQKTIMTYLAKMTKDGRLIARGDRGSYQYSAGKS